jgi:hypothetical protein
MNINMKKYTVLSLAIVFLFGSTTLTHAELNTSQVNSIISLLQAFGADQSVVNNVRVSLTGGTPTTTTTQIKTLQEQVKELKSELAEAKIKIKFTETLYRGISGDKVIELQEFLKQFPDIYPEGLVTGYFGPLTETAVQKLQEKHDIVSGGTTATTGYGQVGPKTRAQLNSLLTTGAGSSGVTPPGLLTAPGIQKKLATSTSPVPPTTATSTTSTTTPSGTTPAIPATPATPSGGGGGGGGGATPATPATPAEPESDTTSPVISNIQTTNIAETSATITWTTDENSDSKISYGSVSPLSGTTTIDIMDSNNVTAHSINLTGLTATKTYYYVVVSSDSGGNTSTSSEYSFVTLQPQPAIGWSDNIRITNDTGESYYPEIEWNDSNYGVVWSDYRDGGQQEVYFAILDSSGNKLISDTRITFTPSAHSRTPEIVWNGTDFAIVYDESNQMHFVRVDMTGSVIGSDVVISGGVGGDSPKIAWNGSGYGIVWHNGGFVYVDNSGSIITNPISLSNFYRPEIEWNGLDFGILYRFWTNGVNNQGGVTTYFRRINSSGTQILSNQTISTGDTGTSFTWNGSVYGVTVYNGLFSTFDNNGNILVDKISVSDDMGDPDIIWSGNSFGIVGHSSDKIRFLEVGPSGSVNVVDTQISTATGGQAQRPNIVWAGSKYGAVWHDSRDGNTEIYFASGD